MIPPLYIAARVKVARNEMTCTVCGETSAWGYCVRCNEEVKIIGNNFAQVTHGKGHLVPTTSYLKPEEYEVL